MATTSKMEYKKIQVTGAVSVERVDRASDLYTILIMGPTGAGKSSFIEALGLKGSSKISRNGLDGCTQAVSTYKLNNVTHRGGPIYLVDSPGFADTKISEMAIVSMLQKWREDSSYAYFYRILYLTPITSVRLPGSQRQVVKTFHALTGVEAARNVMIVTTMWDTIWGEQATKRAEANYQQLQSEIWKTFIEEGAQIMQFRNTKESALSILDQTFGSDTSNFFSIELHHDDIKRSPFKANLLTDLQDRIQNLESHIPTLCDGLAHAEARGDKMLLSTLCPSIIEAEEDLVRFQKELDDFRAPPAPSPDSSDDDNDGESETEENVGQETKQSAGEQSGVVGSHIITASHIQPIPVTPTRLVAPLIPHVSVTPEAVASSIPPLEEQRVALPDDSPSLTPIPTDSRPVVREIQPMPPQQLVAAAHAPARFAQIFKKLKCWGDPVAELHEN